MKTTETKEFQVTTGEVPVVTPEMFNELRRELRELHPGWAEKIIEQMKNNENLEPELRQLTYPQVYLLFNGSTKNRFWQVIVYNQGRILKERLLHQIKQVV